MIIEPYILFTRVPIIKDKSGHLFCDPLWAKDLELHLEYIDKFGICCPVEKSNEVIGLKDITDLGIKWVFELKKDYGLKSVLQNLLPNFAIVTKACKKAKIVHSGGAGWAFPLSFYLLFLKPFLEFQWVMVIESSFWMLEKDEKKGLRKILEHYVHKIVLMRCVKVANARIFTQSFYRDYFLGDEKKQTMINPATWVNKNNILSPEIVKNRFQEKASGKINIIYPTRLVENKGVFVVFDAIEELKNSGISVNITIMGAGNLREDCQRFVNNDYGNVNVEYLEPVDYGEIFFETLAQYDFVLIPTLKQEQPRIIFDAFSQGVAVIGSDTSGIRDITNKNNAFIFKRGDSSSLAEVIANITRNSETVLQMGLSGLNYVSGKTHLQMHQDRHKFLSSILSP